MHSCTSFFLVRETCSELVTALFRPSFSCEFLVRVSWTENLGRLSWALTKENSLRLLPHILNSDTPSFHHIHQSARRGNQQVASTTQVTNLSTNVRPTVHDTWTYVWSVRKLHNMSSNGIYENHSHLSILSSEFDTEIKQLKTETKKYMGILVLNCSCMSSLNSACSVVFEQSRRREKSIGFTMGTTLLTITRYRMDYGPICGLVLRRTTSPPPKQQHHTLLLCLMHYSC